MANRSKRQALIKANRILAGEISDPESDLDGETEASTSSSEDEDVEDVQPPDVPQNPMPINTPWWFCTQYKSSYQAFLRFSWTQPRD